MSDYDDYDSGEEDFIRDEVTHQKERRDSTTRPMNTQTEQPRPITAVAIRESNMAVSHALGVNEILEQVRLIQDVMHKVMKEGEHYGKIPGCGDKATLLQPGAQKLTMTFRLAPEYQLQETDLARGHKEYRVICTLKSIQSGNFVGQGVGCCSTMESKYRYRGGSRKCPNCGKETIIKGKAEYGGGWLCFAKKGGCGSKWPDGEQVIESQSIDRVEHDNPADFYNTVLKMAKKRAFVDATITATAASDIFTQDIGDEEVNGDAPEAPRPQTTTSTPPAAKNATKAPSRPNGGQREATPETRAKMLKELAPYGEVLLHEYAVKSGTLLESEDLSDWPLSKVPTDWGGLRKLMKSIEEFRDGGAPPTQKPFDPMMDVRQDTPPAGTCNADDQPDDVPYADNEHPLPKEIAVVIVPIPRKGQKRDDYLKHPDTIGSLFAARHGTDDEAQEARQRLWGFVSHYEPKGWMKKDGTQIPPSSTDIQFREKLDAFAEWFKKHHPDEKL